MNSARYLTPAIVAAPVMPVETIDTPERHRMALVMLRTLRAAGQPIDTGIDHVIAAAVEPLPWLTRRGEARARRAQDTICGAVLALPRAERVPVALAVAHELMATAPLAPDLDAPCPWRDVLRALGAAQTAAGVEITEAHERAAAAIVAGVTL